MNPSRHRSCTGSWNPWRHLQPLPVCIHIYLPPNKWPSSFNAGRCANLPSSRCACPGPITVTQPPNSGWRHFESGRSSSSSQPFMKAPSRTDGSSRCPGVCARQRPATGLGGIFSPGFAPPVDHSLYIDNIWLGRRRLRSVSWSWRPTRGPALRLTSNCSGHCAATVNLSRSGPTEPNF